MKRYLPYNKNLKQFSRDLRNQSTQGEMLLWQKLKARNMMGYQFNRQKPMENFIVDFYCGAVKLIIEVDGGYHLNPAVVISDKEREDHLKIWGLNFLRFTEIEVTNKINEVMVCIENYIVQFEKMNPLCLQFKNRHPISRNNNYSN